MHHPSAETGLCRRRLIQVERVGIEESRANCSTSSAVKAFDTDALSPMLRAFAISA